MKILVLSDSGYGAWLAAIFDRAGHDVELHIRQSQYHEVLRGIAPPLSRTRRRNTLFDLIIYDMTGHGDEASKLAQHCSVIGDSTLADALEDDRAYGIQVMEQCGINVPAWERFDSISAAKRFVAKTNKRYVYKPSGSDDSCEITYVSEGAEDLLKYFDHLERASHGDEFILQEVVSGTEVSTEGYFNGAEWFFVNNTLEEKKFMNAGKGPNTGCSGNVVWSYARGCEPRLFHEGLERLTPFLIEHGYRGMIDLNTIVGENKLYGLEFTPRFGYDASATALGIIGTEDYAAFLAAVASQASPTHLHDPRFSASVRLSIPPYPGEFKDMRLYSKDTPIEGIDDKDLREWYLYDVMLADDDTLVSAGASGFIGCPIAQGATIAEAFLAVGEMIKGVKIPNVQYRTDIKECCEKRYKALKDGGWL